MELGCLLSHKRTQQAQDFLDNMGTYLLTQTIATNASLKCRRIVLFPRGCASLTLTQNPAWTSRWTRQTVVTTVRHLQYWST